MNILILSVGTRCQLVKYFKNRNSGFDMVITTDCSKYSPALYLSDKYYIVPPMTDITYIDKIKKICVENKIAVILPLNEKEMCMFANRRDDFMNIGCQIVASDTEVVDLCSDKLEMSRFLKKHSVPCVDTYSFSEDIKGLYDESYGYIVKERYGAGSMGMLRSNNYDLVKMYAENSENEMILQPYMEGTEYGIDAYIDFVSGELVSVFAKKKIRMRAGETEKSISVIDDRIYDLVQRMTDILKLRGPVDIDIICENEKYHILEINPRFGGGYPHAYKCGVDFTQFISNNARGKSNEKSIGNYQDQEVLLKYTEVMLIDEKDMYKG